MKFCFGKSVFGPKPKRKKKDMMEISRDKKQHKIEGRERKLV